MEKRKMIFPTKSTTCEEPVYRFLEKQNLINQELKHKSYVNPLTLLKFTVNLESKLTKTNSKNQELITRMNDDQITLDDNKAELIEIKQVNEKPMAKHSKAEAETEKLKNRIDKQKTEYENKVSKLKDEIKRVNEKLMANIGREEKTDKNTSQ